MNKDSMIFIAGGGSRLDTCLPVFLKSKIKLSAVFVSKDENSLSIKKTLKNHKVKIVKKWSSFVKLVNNSNDPIVFFISFNTIINPKELSSARLINYHASPLPKYRGGSPMNWAIINGEKEFGVSIHELVKSIDAGPILTQEYFSIENFDYPQLVEKVNKSYLRLTKILLSSFETFWKNRILQDEKLVSYFHQRKPENSQVFFLRMSSNMIIKFFKALPKPLPRPFFKFKKNIYIISSCKLPKNKYYGLPGRVLGNFEEGIIVVCKSGSIILESLINIKDNREYPARKFLKAGDQIND